MLYQTEGIVVSQNDLGEYDRVVCIFTRAEGLVQAVVKGARRPMSKLSAVTQPHTRAVFQLFRGRTLDRVTQVDLKTSHPGIALDYGKMVYAGFLSELIRGVVPERERNEAMFDFYDRVLTCLEVREDPWPAATWGVLGILVRAGFGPSFGRCALCGDEVTGDRARGDEARGGDGGRVFYFSARDGGTVCSKCRGLSRSPQSLPEIAAGTARTLEILAVSSAQDGSCPNVTARGTVRSEAGTVLIEYVGEVLGRRPRSASLLESMEGDPFRKE